MVTHQQRVGIRGAAPGEKQERELGWFGWSLLRDISGDGRKILFEEEGNGLRDTDGSPPARIGEGIAKAISPDAKWAITKPAKGGPLSLVPTGAGESRQLTHDGISYGGVRWLPDGKRVLATGIEAGHGARDYLIDLTNGDSKPPGRRRSSVPPSSALSRRCADPTENGEFGRSRGGVFI